MRGAVLAAMLVAMPAVGTAADDYAVLLDLARAAPQTADFAQLRFSYAASSGYQPYSRYPDAGQPMKDAVTAQDWKRVLAIAAASLERNYVRMRPHFYTSLAYTRLGDPDRAAHHRAFFDGLYRSMIANTDGRTLESAIKVIDIEEEYDVLLMQRLQKRTQGLVQHGGRAFDRIDVVDDAGAAFALYFDVTLPLTNAPFKRPASP